MSAQATLSRLRRGSIRNIFSYWDLYRAHFMARVVKIGLIWLLAFALPLQGWAATARLSCEVLHRTAIVSPAALPAGNWVDLSASHWQHGAPDEALSMQKSSDASKSAKHASCSACAACSVGAVVLPAGVQFAPIDQRAANRGVHPVTAFTGFIPPGPERPPRVSLVS